MGTYVYALNTKTRTVSNVTLGVAEYRYKESYGFGGARESEELHRKLCARRVAHFHKDRSLLPRFMVLGKMEENREVYVCTGVVTTGDDIKRVGRLAKVGRSWVIRWEPGFDPATVPAHTKIEDVEY